MTRRTKRRPRQIVSVGAEAFCAAVDKIISAKVIESARKDPCTKMGRLHVHPLGEV